MRAYVCICLYICICVCVHIWFKYNKALAPVCDAAKECLLLTNIFKRKYKYFYICHRINICCKNTTEVYVRVWGGASVCVL